MDKKETNALMEKILTIADVMKTKIGWTSILVHTDSEDNIIGFSLGKDADWDMHVDKTYEAIASEGATTSKDKH